ncbi:MAG: hypothetical protein QNJ22_15055 [Desulfosarcinaceae bacterium]|nr:hypothetical protein [Desulfosarcinaceae bacterium]
METSTPERSVVRRIKELHQQLIENMDTVNLNLKRIIYTDEECNGTGRLDEVYVVLNLANHGIKELEQAILGIKPTHQQQESKAISLMARDHLRCLERMDDPDRILSRVRSSIKAAFSDSADQIPSTVDIDDAIRKVLAAAAHKGDPAGNDAVIAA